MARKRRTPATSWSDTRRWLELPSRWWRTSLSVAIGGVLFWWLIKTSGGFTTADAGSTLYSATMMAHGNFSCAYPSFEAASSWLSGPVYSIVSAITQWITRAGFARQFPTSHQLGANCHHATAAFTNWYVSPWVLKPLLRTALVAWLGLTVAGIFVLRTSELRGTRSTWLIPLAFAVTPPLIFVLQEQYHPQDIWALALTFVATALWLRRSSWGTGVVLALAVMSQQYAILAVVIFLVISAPRERWRIVGAGTLTVLAMSIPMYVIGGRGGLSAVFLGTGNTVPEFGSWMLELHVNNAAGLAIARAGPIVATFLLAVWCRSRGGNLVRDPVVLLGLLATGWSLRLVFEENLFAYYPMATGVTLVLRDVIARRISRGTILWLGAVLFAFDDIRNNTAPWRSWPDWIWQVTLVPAVFLIAVYSLRRSMRDASASLDTDMSLSTEESLAES